jgi:hypothetical protein
MAVALFARPQFDRQRAVKIFTLGLIAPLILFIVREIST